MLFFFFEMAIFGSGMAVVERLLFVYLQDDLGASTTLCGLTVGVTVVFEIPIFYYGDWLMQKLHHDGMFLVAMICYIFRVFGYTLLTAENKVLFGFVWFCFSFLTGVVVVVFVSAALLHSVFALVLSPSLSFSLSLAWPALFLPMPAF